MNSTSYAPPGESSSDLWLERSNFSGSLLGGVAYGIHLSVFAATVYFMTRAPAGGKIAWPFVAFVCALLALGTIIVGANTKFDQMMFIDDRNIPGGPNAFLEVDYSTPVNTLGNTAYIVANFLADGVLLYRLFIVWNSNYLIMIIPSLAYLASTGLSILTLFQAAQPGASLWTHTTVVFAVPYWSLTIALNIVLTLLIAARLLQMRQKVVHSLGVEHSRMYTSIAAMVLESGAMYSITGLVFIICFARNSNVQNLVLPVLGQAMCIAPELIMLRVALGRAWSRQTTAALAAPRTSAINMSYTKGSQHGIGPFSSMSKTLASHTGSEDYGSSSSELPKVKRGVV